MPIIRKRLYVREGAPPETRYNPETGDVETSPDGGVTWNENPSADPRTNPAYLLPPLGSAAACQAADGMVQKMKEFVGGAVVITAVPSLASYILSGMVFLLPVSWLFGLAFGIAGALLTIGASAIATAFTAGVWDDIQCILYCTIGDDGRVSQAQLDAAYSKIATEIGDTVVTTVVGHIFNAWGFVGMSNAGTYGDPDADCSECLCNDGWCYEFDFTTSAHGFVGIYGGTWVSGVGFTSPGDSVYAYKTFGFTVHCKEISVYIANPGILSTPNTSRRICLNDTAVTCTPNNATLDPDGGYWYGLSGGFDITSLSFGQERSNADTSFLTSIIKIRFSNDTGENPFGADNCG